MTQLGCYNNTPSLKALVNDVWTHLLKESSNDSQVQVSHLRNFLYAVMHFDVDFIKQKDLGFDDEENLKKVDPKALGRLESDQLVFRDNELRYIHKHFLLMQNARQDSLLTSKKQAYQERANQFNEKPRQFKPQTNPNSKKLLSKKNPKEQYGEGVSYQDYLIKRGFEEKQKHE